MYSEKIEALIKAALADGVLAEKEKQILFKKAQAEGIDLDEFEMVLDARLVELHKAEKEKVEKSAPKSDKYGSVRKCPACGAIVGAFVGVCEECGYEFSNIEATVSYRKFHEALAQEEDVEKQLKIIETFPIPNAKADLLEFLTVLKPRILDASDSGWYTDAYLKKYSECIEKARVMFPNDKLLRPFIAEFEELKSRVKKNKRKDFTIGFVGLFLPVFFAIALPLLISFTNKKIQEYKVERCITYINEGQADKAKEILPTIKFKKKTVGAFYDVATKLVEFYVNEGDIDKAYDVYGNCTPRKPNKYPYRSLWIREGTGGYYRDLIKNAYIAQQQYDKALKCVNMQDEAFYADEYYKFMSDVIYYLCKNGKKSEAKNFVAEYSTWFERNVDTNSIYKDGEYSYSKAKSRLLKVIANY